MILGAVGTITPGDIRYALYHRALKTFGHLIGTTLKVEDAAALIAVEMPVEIRNAVIVTLAVG